MSLPPIASIDTARVLSLRAQILERNAAIAAKAAPAAASGAFDTAIAEALKGVNAAQAQASAAVSAFETGQSTDIAAVMLARQKAAIGFEATLAVRNKLLAAYRDIMNMPV